LQNQRRVTEQSASEELGWECEGWVRPVIVSEGKESFLFQEKFAHWEVQQDVQNSTPTTARKKVSEVTLSANVFRKHANFFVFYFRQRFSETC
jgi:hypothetical protein